MNLERPLAAHPYGMLPAVPGFNVVSHDIVDGEPLSDRHAGAGGNTSPHLAWSGYPGETQSFLINCFDPDAPTPAGWWHWTVANIGAGIREIATGAGNPDGSQVPPGAIQVHHDGGGPGYYGSAPPPGDRPHRYIFAVHALDVPALDITEDTTPTHVAFQAIFHTIARATITPTYQIPADADPAGTDSD